MDNRNAYHGLSFELQTRRIPVRVIVVIAGLVIFTVLWWVIPQDALYWLFAPLLAIIIWMASYGWQPALTHFVRFLQYLEQL